MTFTPILASETTAALLLPLVILFWVVIGASTVAGILSLVLYGFRRVQRWVGIILALLSTAAGIGGSMLFVTKPHPGDIELLQWAGVVTPLLIGVLSFLLWKNRKQV